MADWDTKEAFDANYRSNVERWGRPGSRPPIVLHYHWAPVISAQSGIAWAGLVSPDYPQLLYDLLGLVPGDAVLLVGCGFNGTGRGLANLGVRVIGTELSAYILGAKDGTEEAEIRAACVAAGIDPDLDTIRGPSGPVNPLDLFIDGGRASPAVRGHGEVLDQDLRVRGSRNAVLNRFNQMWPGVTPRHIVTEEVLNSITDAQALLVCDYAAAASSEWGSTVVHMLSPLQIGSAQAPDLNWKTYSAWRAFLDGDGFSAQMILPTVTADGQGMTLPPGQPDGRVVAYSGLF